MNFPIRLRLTVLYFLVLAASFLAFFWICDYGFERSIETTVNDASRNNLQSVQHVIANTLAKQPATLPEELTELSDVWSNGAIFQVRTASGESFFRSPRFLKAAPTLPEPPAEGVGYFTTNLDRMQYRVASQRATIGGTLFFIDAAIPTEPFDQALDHFRLIEREFLPLLVLLASVLGYWLSARALAPVDRIITSAERIGVRDLSQRLEVPKAKDELRRLTETVNAMLGRIESSVKRITQFTADASHDLRTPLSLIRTNAELALRRPRSEAEYRETLSRILSASEETTELIEHLLTLARADAGAAHLRFEPVDLQSALLEIAQQARVLAQAKGLSFSAQLKVDGTVLSADLAAFDRLLLILFDNAVKYTPPGGAITLRAFREEERAILEVEDNGIGIPPADLPRIFDRFFRADQVRSREISGSGLGLAIAHWIVQSHRGEITAQSSPATGSVLRVMLPVAELAGASQPLAQRTGPPATPAI